MKTRCPSRRRERGMATLAVLMVLVVMVAFALAQSQALVQLKREMKLIEQRQLKKY